MRFAVIGSGRAASSLALALRGRGHELAAITCRSPDHARVAAQFLGDVAIAADNVGAALTAEVCLIGVPDDAIAGVALELAGAAGSLAGKVFLHLSGASDAELLAPLRDRGASVGSLHPLQTFPERVAEADYLRGVTFGIDGDQLASATAATLTRDLGGRPLLLAPGTKALYHAAAVVASNATTATLDLALTLLNRVGLNNRKDAFDALLPLVLGTLGAIEEQGGANALTGPIARGDVATVRRHLEALGGDEQASYRGFAAATLRLARRHRLMPDAARGIEGVLANRPLTIVASLKADTAAELALMREAQEVTADLFEHRLDLLKQPLAAPLNELAKRRAIVTLRAGGEVSAAAAREVLHRALALGASYVDCALGEEADLPRDRLVISYHGDLADAAAAAKRIAALAPAVGKVAVAIGSPADLASLPEIARILRLGCREVAVMALGEIGAASRPLARRLGSDWIYGATDRTRATAAGQVPITDLSDLYRARHVTAASRVFALAGSPIAHSLSPRLMNRILPELLGDAIYVPLDATGPGPIVALARALPLDGISVTMPLKQAMAGAVDLLTDEARATGSVNTVIRHGSHLLGANTDVLGVINAAAALLPLGGARALVLGAGGAGRAAAWALRRAGAVVSLHARDAGRGAAAASAVGVGAVATTRGVEWDLLVNATPVGMGGSAGASPLPADELSGLAVVELVYEPRETELLRQARARGLRTACGLDVFLAQAAAQIAWWSGVDVSVERLRRALPP